MTTYPTAHSSSPAPTKETTASTTIASGTITGHPGRSCLVVTVTSDADTNTGGVPTIAQTGGEPITWTRIPIALGYSSTGDVGLVVAFAGVFQDLATPPASRANLTVTVTLPGITASKPKLLIPRVYDDTQVDITDPIGAAAGGSFSSGTLITGTLTPETSEGGIRGVQLDWGATGVPATFLPNNANTELVDSYHNVALSTNLAIGGRRRTRAGVAETLGVILPASSTDGNWLIYELRSPQPAAGPAFDGGFASDAFQVAGGPASYSRSTSEATTTADSASRTRAAARTATDSTTAADTTTRTTSRPRAATEATSTADSTSRTAGAGRLQLETTTTTDLAAAAAAAARTILETLTTLDDCSPTMGLPPFEVEVLRIAGRQRQVVTAGRPGRSFTASGRPAEPAASGRRRTFSWSGRDRPPITGSTP